MSVIGIDLGNCRLKVGMPIGGRVDLVLNDVTARETPTMAGFSDKERTIGEAALTKQKMEFANTITNVKMFLGRLYSEELTQAEIPHSFCRIVEGENGRVEFIVDYRQEETRVAPEQILGSLFHKLRDFAEMKIDGGRVADCVVSVPPYFTESQRRSIVAAAHIGGLNCLQVASDSLCIGMQYAFSRVSELPSKEEQPRVVLFVDYGHCNLTASVIQFTNESMQVLSSASDPTIGTRVLDLTIAEYIREQFLSQYRVDVRSRPRSWLRVLDTAEKTKKILSANPFASISIPNLYDDYDFSGSITREEFESRASGMFERILLPVKRAVDDSGIPMSQIHSVEVVGGGSRVPLFKTMLGDLTQMPLSTTLSATECIANGAAWLGALLSPKYRVKPFEFKDSISYSLLLSYREENEAPSSSEKYFTRGEHFPIMKAITFPNPKSVRLSVDYAPCESDDPFGVPSGHPSHVADFLVHVPAYDSSDGRKRKAKVIIEINQHGTVALRKAQLIEEWIDLEYPDSGAKDQEPETNALSEEKSETETAPEETNKEAPKPVEKSKSRKQDLQVDVMVAASISSEAVQRFKQLEDEMTANDLLVIATSMAKNLVESYIYDMRGKVSYGDLSDYAEDQEKASFLELLDATESWLYGDGDDVSQSEYEDKLTVLKARGEPIANRKNEDELRLVANERLEGSIREAEAFALDQSEQFIHIDDSERSDLLGKVESAKQFLREVTEQRANLPKSSDGVMHASQVDSVREKLVKSLRDLQRKPKPKPAEPAVEVESNAEESVKSSSQQQADDQSPPMSDASMEVD